MQQNRKLEDLKRVIGSFDRVVVALSGGLDSSYLLSICVDVLGIERVSAMTADSPLLPRAELEVARRIAEDLGVELRVLPFDELSIPEIAANDTERCYHCKLARFDSLKTLAREAGDALLLHGENADDLIDYRPGSRAAKELGVRAPLAETGWRKSEIREAARLRGLPNWDLPAASCLATRFAYGTRLTREGLGRVEEAEESIRSLSGARQLRVRDAYPTARIEVLPSEIPALAEEDVRIAICRRLHSLGYRYVSLDLDGYRMGSMNEGLSREG